MKAGTGLKPPDWRCVPLCRLCHDLEEAGKLTFWAGCAERGISDPFGVSTQLRRVSGNIDAGWRSILHARPGLPTAEMST